MKGDCGQSARPALLECGALRWGFDRAAPLGGPLSLRLHIGECVAIVGPNGAGKSTLLHTLGGACVALGGEIRLGGTSLSALDPAQRAMRVGLLRQQPELDLGLTVRELVLLGRTPHLGRWGVPSGDDWARVEAALKSCELQKLATRPLGRISGGERQRAELAMVLALDAPLLLLDEPTSALDLRHRHGFFSLLSRLRAERGLAVVIVLHELADAFREASRVVVLGAGTGQAAVARELDAGDPTRVALLAAAFEVPPELIRL